MTKERKKSEPTIFFRPIDDHMSWKTEGRKRGWLRRERKGESERKRV